MLSKDLQTKVENTTGFLNSLLQFKVMKFKEIASNLGCSSQNNYKKYLVGLQKILSKKIKISSGENIQKNVTLKFSADKNFPNEALLQACAIVIFICFVMWLESMIFTNAVETTEFMMIQQLSLFMMLLSSPVVTQSVLSIDANLK